MAQSFIDVRSLAKWMRENDRFLVGNLGVWFVGHVIIETDNFMRMRELGEIEPAAGYILMTEDVDNRMATLKEILGPFAFDVWYIGAYYGFLGRVLAHIAPDRVIDIGTSDCKYVPSTAVEPEGVVWEEERNVYKEFVGGNWCEAGHGAYYERRSKTPDFFPFMKAVTDSEEIETFIGARGGKVAVVQAKIGWGPGTAVRPEPDSYEPSLALLKDEGFTLVFAGREPMPEPFKKYDMVDYANSSLATFQNDFRLFKRADFGVTCGSGIAMFLEIFDKPFAYLNTTTPTFPPFSRRAVYNPALIRSNAENRLLTMSEMMALPWKQVARQIGVTSVKASPAQMAAVVREALERRDDPDRPPTPLQAKARSFSDLGCVRFSNSVIAEAVLKDHEALMV